MIPVTDRMYPHLRMPDWPSAMGCRTSLSSDADQAACSAGKHYPLHETEVVSSVPLRVLALLPQARRAETLTKGFDTEEAQRHVSSLSGGVAVRDFNYELKNLCRRNRDGSFATRADRERILDHIANQLHDMGFRHMQASSLKPKHIEALVQRWHAEAIAPGTFKNRMATLRWLVEKIAKQNIMARTNAYYQIPSRVFVSNVSKAKVLDLELLERVTDPYTAASLRLQSAFGLRRAESIKIQPGWADRGETLALKDTWTKGGRAREVPIRTAEQRAALDHAKALAGSGSLIPNALNYVNQLQRFKAQCQLAGIDHVHGIRHHYAQSRFQELTGWACPAQGGPPGKALLPEQRATDLEARLTISAELGHDRAQVTAIYLGR